MTLDLAALRAVAEAATQGDWRTDTNHARDTWVECDGPVICNMPRGYDPVHTANAAHIAAFDPPTALALIARAEEANTLEAERDALKQENAILVQSHKEWRASLLAATQREANARAERDRLAAQVARIEQAERWAKAWKAKTKENRYWEREMRESAKYWANQESDRLGQLLTAEAERDRLREQTREANNALAVAFSVLHKISLMTSLSGEVDDYEAVADSVRGLADERDRLREQVARMTEAMGSEWNIREGKRTGFCRECGHSKEVGHSEGCKSGRFFAALKATP